MSVSTEDDLVMGLVDRLMFVPPFCWPFRLLDKPLLLGVIGVVSDSV